MSLVEGGEAD